MSLENAKAFVARLDKDADLKAKVGSSEDAVRLGAALQTPFTADEFQQAQADASAELSSEDMQNIAGGRPIAM